MHVLRGTARIVMEDHIEYVSEGQVHYCPKGCAHMTEPAGMGDLVVLAVIPEHE
jgi:mannose-6-phosphate isomerase-like protein (cupin superfamily)